jgi:hypothetical protein
MNTFNLGRAAVVYNLLLAAVASMPDAIVKPGHFLQSEQILVNGKNNYTFGVTKQANSTAIRSSEMRLDPNDVFVGLLVGFFVKREIEDKAGSGILQTYGNGQVFADVADEVSQNDIDALWNSYLTVKVGSIVYADNLDLNPCRVVNTTAQSSSTTRSEHKSFDGYVESLPFIALDGGKNNLVTVQAPQYGGTLLQHVTSDDRNYATLKMYGFLVTGGSQYAQGIHDALSRVSR